MEINASLLKYFLLLAVAFAWVYYRLIKSRRKRSKTHGRELLRERFRQRRLDRISEAETWEERRRLRDNVHSGRRIKPEFLKRAAGLRPEEIDREGPRCGPERPDEPDPERVDTPG